MKDGGTKDEWWTVDGDGDDTIGDDNDNDSEDDNELYLYCNCNWSNCFNISYADGLNCGLTCQHDLINDANIIGHCWIEFGIFGPAGFDEKDQATGTLSQLRWGHK